MHIYFLLVSVCQESEHDLVGLSTSFSHAAAIMVSARVGVSSGGLNGEGPTSKPMWLLAGFISSRDDGQNSSVFLAGCLWKAIFSSLPPGPLHWEYYSMAVILSKQAKQRAS